MVVVSMEIYNLKTFLDTLIRRRIMHSWADIFNQRFGDCHIFII